MYYQTIVLIVCVFICRQNSLIICVAVAIIILYYIILYDIALYLYYIHVLPNYGVDCLCFHLQAE